MLSVLKTSPKDAFVPGSLEKGISTHRWGKYVIPSGKTALDMDRDADGRLIGEVPGDGNVFDHQMAQERLVREYGHLDVGSAAAVESGFVKFRPISISDVRSLRVTALVHDLGEMEFGDTVYDEKHTIVHSVKDEVEATRKFVNKYLAESDPRRHRRLERNIMASYAVDHDKDHRLYGIFKLYEKYSYLQGAIAIFAEGRGSVANSHHAVHNVLKNQTAALVSAAESGVPSAKTFLSDRADDISRMFEWVTASGFEDGSAEIQKSFEANRALWAEYLRKTA